MKGGTQMKLINIVQLKTILSNFENQKLPIQLSYKIMKLNKEIESDFAFYQEKFKEIITEFGEIDNDGNLIFMESGDIKIKPGTQTECMGKLFDLEHTEVKKPSIKLTLTDLDGIELTPNELAGLDEIIEA